MNTTSTTRPPAVAVPARVRRSWSRAVGDVVRTVIGFIVYGWVSGGASLGSLLASFVVRDRVRREFMCQGMMHRGARRWENFMERIDVFHIDFPELDKVRAMRGTILAPNHTSLIDAPHFVGRLPRLICVMKKGLLTNPFMSAGSHFSGYLPLEKGRVFIRRGRDALLAGNNLLIFPEGTRTIDPPVNSFKNGFALMATLANAPVQTIFIEMPVLYLGKRWPLWRIPIMPVPIKIRLGRQFRPQPGQSAKAFSAELEEYFRSELKPTAGRGVQRK